MYKIIRLGNFELTINTRYGAPYICLYRLVVGNSCGLPVYKERRVFAFGGIFGKGI